MAAVAGCIDGNHFAVAKKQRESNTPETPTFERSLGELEQIVRHLEQGDVGLSESLKHYERGVNLLRQCYALLENAERRIEILSGVDADGNPLTAPMDDTSLSLDQKAESRSRRRTAPPQVAKPGGPAMTPRGSSPGSEQAEGKGEEDLEADEGDVDRSGKLF